MSKVPATILNAKHVAIDPRTVDYIATIELRTFAEMGKGPEKGRGFAWVTVEDIKVDNMFSGMERARKIAVELGYCSEAEAQAASLIMIQVNAQYGADGMATVLRTFDHFTQHMIAEKVF